MKFSKVFEVLMIAVIASAALFGCTPAATPTAAPAAPAATTAPAAPAAPAATTAPAAPAATMAPAAPAAATTAPAAATGAKYKVAVVISGPVNDQGFNEDGLLGVQKIHDKLGWDYAYTENCPAAQQENVLRQYAQQGYNLVIAYGYEYSDSLKAVAPDFPKTMFAIVNTNVPGANIVSTDFKYGELGYFTGMAAGLMTKNHKIGVVAAEDAPQVTADTDTMVTGVKSVDPTADVNVSFVGSWIDVVKGQQVTQAQIDRGVDILIIVGDSFTPPAIKLAQSKGIKVIGGWSGDDYHIAPDTVITSGVQDFPNMFLALATQFQNGTLKPNTDWVSGFKEGTQYLGHWGDFVPQTVQDKVNQAVQDYLAGKLDIGIKS